MKQLKILIMGYGVIGQHLQRELNKLEPLIYDKYKNDLNHHSIISDKYDIAFVAVPTEMKSDGSADVSEVEWAVANVNADVIVIKSTVPVGTTNRLAEKYPDKELVMSPEHFGVTQHAPSSPNFLILGGAKDNHGSAEVAQLYYRIKTGSFRIMFTDAKTAELAKYMLNSFLAMKVVFINEFAGIAGMNNIIFEELREAFVMDPRVGDSHTFALKDQPYYDSHCFNKDIPALLNFVGMDDGNPWLMKAVHDVNEWNKEA